MEPDRYQQSSKLFVIGIISLLVSLTLFIFSLFILPFLLWNLHYNVPEFISNWREWFKEAYNFNDLLSSWIVFFLFIVPAALSGYLSYWASNHIDNAIYGIEVQKTPQDVKKKKEIQESLGVGLKLVVLILLAVAGIFLVEWVLFPT